MPSSHNIAAELTFGGHTLRQVFLKNSVAIYERSRPNFRPHELELIVIKVLPEHKLPNGAVTPAHETYPRASEWGRLGWSFPIAERDFVFALAEQMAGFEGPYGQWVREQITTYKKSKIEIPADSGSSKS